MEIYLVAVFDGENEFTCAFSTRQKALDFAREQTACVLTECVLDDPRRQKVRAP